MRTCERDFQRVQQPKIALEALVHSVLLGAKENGQLSKCFIRGLVEKLKLPSPGEALELTNKDEELAQKRNNEALFL